MGKKLPYMKMSVNMAEDICGTFAGINKSEGITDGAIFDTLNITSDYYPAIGTRPKRRVVLSLTGKTIYGMGYSKKLFYCASKSDGTAAFYYDGEECFPVSATYKTFAVINGRICIFPDKLYFSEAAMEAKNKSAPYDTLEDLHKAKVADKTIFAGDIYIVGSSAFSYNPAGVWRENLSLETDNETTPYAHQAQTEWIYLMERFGTLEMGEEMLGQRMRDEDFEEISPEYEIAMLKNPDTGAWDTVVNYADGANIVPMKVGDAVEIKVQYRTMEKKDGKWKNIYKIYSALLSKVGIDEIRRCYTYTFDGLDLPKEIEEDSETYMRYNLWVKKSVPDFDVVFSHDNRLWGAKGNTIYASALGDPSVWTAYTAIASGAWAWAGGTAEAFTGGCSFDGYPTFFDETRIIRIGGSYPAEYTTYETKNISGIKKGCAKTLASDGSYLYYVSPAGVMRYSGAFPGLISLPLGLEIKKAKEACAGAVDGKYYLSAEGVTYVYDSLRQYWLIEDKGKPFSEFLLKDSELIGISGSKAYVMNNYDSTAGAEFEGDVGSYVEFSPFFDGCIKNKGLSKIGINLSVSGKIEIFIAYGSGEYSKVWEQNSSEQKSYYIPLIIRRSDMYKIKITAHGSMKIYALTRTRYKGSEK